MTDHFATNERAELPVARRRRREGDCVIEPRPFTSAACACVLLYPSAARFLFFHYVLAAPGRGGGGCNGWEWLVGRLAAGRARIVASWQAVCRGGGSWKRSPPRLCRACVGARRALSGRHQQA